MRNPLEVVNENTTHRGKVQNPETDASLREWRVQWKRQLQQSIFYLDHVEPNGFQTISAHLSLLGVQFSKFFDRRVTHVITSRALDVDHKDSDVLTRAKAMGQKIWTVEKLERFLTSLLGHSPRKQLNRADNMRLGQLLQNEKIMGPSDKEQWMRFPDSYVLVYDPSNRYKPIVYKEWKNDWPQIYPDTAAGICPFVLCRKPPKRAQTEQEQEEEESVKRQAVDEEGKENKSLATAMRQTTMRHRQYGEIVASGMQRNSVTSAIISNAPTELMPASREVATLQRKVLPPPKPKKVKKARKPGFCENCYERFDNIDDHVLSTRHRRYASDKRNFEVLDRIIEAYQRPPSGSGLSPEECPSSSQLTCSGEQDY